MTLQMLRSPLKPYQPSGGLWLDGQTGYVQIDTDPVTGIGVAADTRGTNDYTLITTIEVKLPFHTNELTIFGSTAFSWNRLFVKSGYLSYYIYDGVTVWYIDKAYTWTDGVHSVAVSYDQTNDVANFIVDGNSIGTQTSLLSPTRGIYRIGATSNTSYVLWKNKIYEAIIIKEALSLSEIRGIMEGRRLPTEWDCRLWMDFRQGHTRDLSGNGNHGTLYGGAYLMPPVTPMAHAIGGLAE